MELLQQTGLKNPKTHALTFGITYLFIAEKAGPVSNTSPF